MAIWTWPVVLGHGPSALWLRRFGGSKSTVGQPSAIIIALMVPTPLNPDKMLPLTRGAMHRISNQLQTVHSPASRHSLGVVLKRLGPSVGLQASRIHLRLHTRATPSSAVEAAGSSTAIGKKGSKEERRFVTTLDPGRLRSEDLLNLSGLSQPSICFPCKEAPAFGSSYDTARLAHRYTSAPVGISPHSHPAAGEVRFRVVRPEDLSLPAREAFSRGSDLTLGHRHSLWNFHLTVVLKKHPVIWLELIDDGIIPPTRAAELESCVLKRIGQGRRWSRVLDSITDPFILGLGTCHPWVLIVHHEGVFKGRSPPPKDNLWEGVS
ncbi:hypothetical protein FA13DRAFT_1775190 [Coprinellus micaceus]|uniref:Uncharacterized protein n=1 Tax=Coprinellus micaceus TaxID=71717 RepID=A0A4Y7T6Z1_COPMI|nr:hypothetical protein FA13DRAFT_1775190 [Coprinellus micaceus]